MNQSASKSGRQAEINGLTRRTAIKQVLVTAAGIAVGWSVIDSQSAKAAGSIPKGVMGYQNTPNGTQRCLGCLQFIPGKNPYAMGSCNIVAGSISPNGWCNSWTAKR